MTLNQSLSSNDHCIANLIFLHCNLDGSHHGTRSPWQQTHQYARQVESSARRGAERAGLERAVARRQAEWEELCGECTDWSVVLQVLPNVFCTFHMRNVVNMHKLKLISVKKKQRKAKTNPKH